MILTTHALIGAAIGKHVKKTWLIIVLSLASHYFLDSFRHGEYLTSLDWGFGWLKIALDLAVGFFVIALFIFTAKPQKEIVFNIILGTFFAMLPDLFIVLYQNFHFNFLDIFVKIGRWFHPYPAKSPQTLWTLRNAANDIILSSIAIFLLFYRTYRPKTNRPQ